MSKLSREMMEQILDMMDPVAVFDQNGYYMYVNQGWRTNIDVNLPDAELQKKRAWDIFPESRVRNVIENHRPITGEIINVHGIPSYVSYLPIFEGDSFKGVLMWQILQGMEHASQAARLVELLRQELDAVQTNLDEIKYEHQVLSDIVGDSPVIRQLHKEILTAARTNSTVLIEGETGTGKELVARAIHRLSRRNKGRFVPINCSAIPENLMESEFFGYEDGAFTGAKRGGRPGKMELADKGTLFLDEIHQMGMSMQPKLLRALQERQIERLGGANAIPVDFRCIAAANINLKESVRKGEFRDDLYYRLDVIHLRVPPLRERKEDIPQLVNALIYRLNARLETNIISANDSALQMLAEYDWPGNVRELQNAVEAAMNRAWDGILEARHFHLDDDRNMPGAHDSRQFTRSKAQLEQELIISALQECGWNKSAAAARLGISRSVLYSKIEKYGLKR